MYKLVYNIVYFVRLGGLKVKFLWDTLNHYLLIKYIAQSLWKEKLIATLGIAYGSYFLYFREAYFVDSSRDYIWIQDFTKRHDKQLRVKLKEVVLKDVFGNPELAAKVAPMLIDLVHQPNIKSLMTDLFIVLLKNPAFVKDTDRLVKGLIHDYLLSEDCFKMFKELIMT